MKHLFITLVSLSLMTGCTNTTQSVTVSGLTFGASEIAEGQRLYTQFCASCHGASGEGQFPNAPTERDATRRFGAPPHNGSGHTWHHGDAMLVDYVRNGGISLSDPMNWYPMPAFGEQMSDEEIMLTLAYIKTMWSDEQQARQAQVTAAENEPNPFQIRPGG